MAQTSLERRNSPRVYIDGPMQYRGIDSQEFLPGRIENISTNGALVWIGEYLPLDSQLVIRVEPDGPDASSADLTATLLYELPEEENSLYGYG
ncbi:MAG: PilZ domain-containing protein, partial [Gammaproteobacteria bacterium]